MSEAVEYSVTGGVAVLAVSNPPVNALSRAVRAGLLAGIARAEADAQVSGIVLIGRGRTFPAGADIAEFGAPEAAPGLGEVCARVEACEKPVIAALHGTALGGGFELALAAHYRVAHAGARVGLPEVRLGLLPGAGGTQRVPRLAGAQVALEMMLSGRSFRVTQAPTQVFIDEVTEGDLLQAAQAFCEGLRAAGHGPRRTRDIRAGFDDAGGYQAQIAKARAQVAARPELAPREIVGAIETAMLLPFEAGLAYEAAAFEDLLASDQSASLRHAFFAERRAAKFPLPEDVQPPEIKTVCVLGGGPLAMQIVACVLQSGLRAQWGTRDPAALERGVAQVRALFQQGVDRGAVAQPKVERLLGNLRHGDSAEMTQGADIILHAARGQGNVPAPPETVRAVAMPGAVDGLGLRFALPVYGARLVEIVQGPGATPQQMAAGLALARRLGKVPVRVMSTGDSVAARMMAALHRAADGLVDLGQSPFAIDDALRDWGWGRPPFELRDAIGLEQMQGQTRGKGAEDWTALPVGMGRLGRAEGAGFYDYPGPDDLPEASGEIAQAIDNKREIATHMPPERIVMLLVGAMANEGLRMLVEGWVSRPSDIDVVMMLGQDFPRWRGGPMMAVDLMGLFAVSRALERIGHPDVSFWKPLPLWSELVKNGRGFASLNIKSH